MQVNLISPMNFKSSEAYFQGQVSARKTAFKPETADSSTFRAQKHNILKRGFFYSLIMLAATIAYFTTFKHK